ncbi:MFS transporter [Siccirubricoccus phaeus]|uniref:MFS transporter n=1 Tax=Siccirubricoccus phaeus TaxID=2595053 RepID=UPI0011F3628D|nr:MFS transporter [Siccirubricoccus phaeus]
MKPGGFGASLGPLGRALAQRDARLFFTASVVSWTGLWVHRIAVAWLAWELTRSAFWVGLVAFCDLAPAVVFSPIAGAIADRVDRVKLTMLSQAVIAVEAATVAATLATGSLTIGLLLLLEMTSGTAASFAQPARQSLMPALVPRAELPAAVACNSLCFSVARLVGPAIAGPLIAWGGVAPAVALNACAYVFASVTMLGLRVDPAERRGHAPEGSMLNEVLAGFRYVARHPGIRPLLIFAATASVLMRGVQEILPPYVERLFHRGPDGLAMLTAAIGVGALFAGLWVANRGRLGGATALSVGAVAVQAVATIGFVATGFFPFALLCAAVLGAAASVHGISTQTLMQSAADHAMRGRVLSLWGMITRACPASGALALGAAGEVFGLRAPTIVAMLLALGVAAWGAGRMPVMVRELESAG